MRRKKLKLSPYQERVLGRMRRGVAIIYPYTYARSAHFADDFSAVNLRTLDTLYRVGLVTLAADTQGARTYVISDKGREVAETILEGDYNE